MGFYARRSQAVGRCRDCRGSGFRDESVLVRIGGAAVTRIERVPCHTCRMRPTRLRQAQD